MIEALRNRFGAIHGTQEIVVSGGRLSGFLKFPHHFLHLPGRVKPSLEERYEGSVPLGQTAWTQVFFHALQGGEMKRDQVFDALDAIRAGRSHRLRPSLQQANLRLKECVHY